MSNHIINLYKGNKLLFGKYYFPHYFRKESPPFHINIVRECSKNLFIAIQAPRGSAKSTVTTFLETIHGICLKTERFVVIVQNTYAKAAGSLNNIKYEFKYNERLKEDFRVDMDIKDAEGDTIFRHSDGYMTRVLCKGADQLGSIRGERFGAYRPTLIIIDDIEDDEMVRNVQRRDELEKQFNEVLNYAGEAGETREIVDGTILHDDSLLSKLLSADKYKRFKKIFYKARSDGKSLWPQKWSIDDLAQMEADDPVGFAKEMQGDPSSGSLETIRREDFRYWRIEESQAILYGQEREIISRWPLKECKAGVGIDLAWESKEASDFAAIVPGLVTPGNDLLVDDYICKKGLRPDEFERIIFDMSNKYERITGKRVCFGFEKAKLEKVMKWFLQEAMKRTGKYLWFKDIAWGTQDKVGRVMFRIANRYSQHAVYHKSGMGELENQLIRLRSTAHDDLADALAMLPEILAWAPTVDKTKPPEDKFNFLRTQTPLWRNKTQSKYIFGAKQRPSLIPAKIGI